MAWRCIAPAKQDRRRGVKIDYDDGDEEVVSESYLRTHRHVYLFLHRPEDDPEVPPEENEPRAKGKRRKKDGPKLGRR